MNENKQAIDISKISAPPPYSGAPTRTRVLGYFNPFDYPFQLHLPELNRQFTLGAREFVTLTVEGKDLKTGKPSRQKVKVNDPILENFVGPNKLAREEAQEGQPEVAILWLLRPVLQPIPTHMFEFAGSSKFKTDDSGRVLMPEAVIRDQQQQMTSVPASASAITGYSVEQAKQMGVIDGTHRGLIREDKEIPEDKTAPVHTRPAALPRSPTPRQPDAKRPVPPPFSPPKDERVLMPKNPPPPAAAQIAATAVAPVTATSAVPPVVSTLDDSPTELLSDIPLTDHKVDIIETDLTKLSRETAISAGAINSAEVKNVAAGIILPEPPDKVAAGSVVAVAPVARVQTVESMLPEPTISETELAGPTIDAIPVAPAPQIPPVVETAKPLTPEFPPAVETTKLIPQVRKTRRTLSSLFSAKPPVQ